MSFVDRGKPLRFDMDNSELQSGASALQGSLPSGESDPAVTLDCAEAPPCDLPPEITEPLPQTPSAALLPPLEPIYPRPDLASDLKPGQTFDPEIPYTKTLEHSPIIPQATKRERTLSDYYGVFGPPRKKE